jgi:hypothetical protein
MPAKPASATDNSAPSMSTSNASIIVSLGFYARIIKCLNLR